MIEVFQEPPKILAKQDFFEDPTLPLQVYIRDPQPIFPMHGHAFDELVVILKGTAMHVIDGQECPVRAGDVFVVSPNQLHQYQDMHGLALANILFDADALMMGQWDIRALPGFHALFALEPAFRSQHRFQSRLQLNARQFSQANALIEQLAYETEQQHSGYRVMARGLFMQLAVLLSRIYSVEPSDESLGLLRIGDAIAYLETHYCEKISLDELASKSHLSKRHFLRIFKECIGRSPIDHLLHIRIQQAVELLRRTDRNVTEISFEVGFTDSNYFARSFKKIMGQSPRALRESWLKNRARLHLIQTDL